MLSSQQTRCIYNSPGGYSPDLCASYQKPQKPGGLCVRRSTLVVRHSTRSGPPFHPLWSAVPPVLVRRSTRAGPLFHPYWSAVPPVLVERKFQFFLAERKLIRTRAIKKPPAFCLQIVKIALNGVQSPRGLRKNRSSAAQNPGFCAKSAKKEIRAYARKLTRCLGGAQLRKKMSKLPLCVLVRRSTRSGPLYVPPVLVRRSTRSGPPFHPFGPPFDPFWSAVPPLWSAVPPLGSARSTLVD